MVTDGGANQVPDFRLCRLFRLPDRQAGRDLISAGASRSPFPFNADKHGAPNHTVLQTWQAGQLTASASNPGRIGMDSCNLAAVDFGAAPGRLFSSSFSAKLRHQKVP